MKNYQKLYTRLMREMDEGFDRDQRYEDMYEFEKEDVVYIYDLEGQVARLQQRIMDGAHCELRHAANDGDRIYVSDSPKDFTQPAFVLS